MPSFTIDKYRGLAQNVDYPDLNPKNCHVLKNLNVDDNVGSLKVRHGSAKKYNEALSGYPFTSLVSAYEYRFEVSSETVLIVNDNGTLKTMTDGGAPASLTLPTGPGSAATLESGFENQYVGHKDHVLISTGNGATNYMLWYGYVDRAIADNDGIFDDALGKTDYLLLKSQLVSVHGTFTNVHDAVTVGDYTYFSFIGSKWIEKRSATTFQLIERFEVAQDAIRGESVALATDGTYIYALYAYGGADNVVDGVKAKKITPSGWTTEATFTEPAATHTAGGICSDGTNVFVAVTNTSAVPDTLFRLNSSMVEQAGDPEADVLDICCDTDTTISTGSVFILKAGGLYERQKDDLAVDLASNTTYAAQIRCFFWSTGTDYIYTTSTTGTGTIYRYPAADITAGVSNNTVVENPHALIEQNSLMRAISTDFGTLESWSESGADSTIFPNFVSINVRTTQASGLMAVGTYFYKIAIEDVDGQIYTLSDPVIQTLDTASYSIWLRLTCHDDDVNYYYRIRNIRIYRAYNEVEDAEIPSTDYKFLKAIDINSSGWKDDTTDHELYYYDHFDNIDEDTISSVTFFEDSGIEDNVKPRYVNGKYMTWVDDQLHLANFYHDGETFRNRIARSNINAPDALAFYDYYDFDVGDGEQINGITEIYGRSVVFKKRKMGVFFDARWEKTYVPGAHNAQAVHKVNELIYFVSLDGMHVFDGRKIINIHYPVEDYFNAINKDSYPPVVYFVDGRDRVYFIMSGAAGGVAVFNIRYKTWTWYDENLSYNGCFKNYEGQYIGWNDQRFYIFEDSTYVNDNEDFGGGNGDAIAIDYESPLMFGHNKGKLAILDTHNHRLFKGTDTITFTTHEYKGEGRTSAMTQALSAPSSGTYQFADVYFYDKIIGESFSFKLNGNVDGGDFRYYGLTVDYRLGGRIYR